MPNPVEVAFGNTRVHVDEDTHSLYSIDAQHAQIHNGNVYTSCRIFESVADNGNADMLLITPADKTVFFSGYVEAAGDSYVYLYEAPTKSNNGTALSRINLNRQSANTAGTTAFYTPTVSDAGTEIRCKFLTGGSGGRAVGSSNQTYQEYIFNTSTAYLVRVTNKSGQARTISISSTWVEL